MLSACTVLPPVRTPSRAGSERRGGPRGGPLCGVVGVEDLL